MHERVSLRRSTPLKVESLELCFFEDGLKARNLTKSVQSLSQVGALDLWSLATNGTQELEGYGLDFYYHSSDTAGGRVGLF